MTPAFIENLKNIKPKLLLRKFKHADADPKDNGLRVPLRVVDKKAGKGKKKGKKKKWSYQAYYKTNSGIFLISKKEYI